MKHAYTGRMVLLFCCAVLCSLFIQQGKVLETMLPVGAKTIILDAGHGGWDPGKTGKHGADEQEINLAIVKKLQAYLEQGGARVYLTRADDMALGKNKNEDMRIRKEMINSAKADILISIHQNAFPSSSVKGAQVFYHANSKEGEQLADCLQEALRLHTDPDNTREKKPNSDYYILRTTNIPAALVECGFLSHTDEERRLNDTAYQEKVAWGIYCGILEYFSKDGNLGTVEGI